MRRRKPNNNGIKAPKAFLEALNHDEDAQTHKEFAFEDSICRQYCEAVKYPKRLMQDLEGKHFDGKYRYLKFEDFDQLNNLSIELKADTYLQYKDTLEITPNELYKRYMCDSKADIIIVNDNSHKSNRGIAILRCGRKRIMIQDLPNGLVSKRGPTNEAWLCGVPYDIFEMLVAGGYLSVYSEQIGFDT